MKSYNYRWHAAHPQARGGPVVVVFDGEPVAKGRPRLGKWGQVYTPRETVAFERALAWLGKIEMAGRSMIEGALRVSVVATFTHAPTCKPDSDNILKSCMDGLQGVVFRDDAAVVFASITKVQGPRPSVRIEVVPNETNGRN